MRSHLLFAAQAAVQQVKQAAGSQSHAHCSKIDNALKRLLLSFGGASSNERCAYLVLVGGVSVYVCLCVVAVCMSAVCNADV